jgi:hypothetical protein
MLECDQPLADDLARALSQAERYAVMKDGADAYYDATTAYEIRDPPNPLAFTWNAFVESVKHESRFFSANHIASLNELFAGLAQFGPGTDERHLFRARRANDEGERIAMCLSPGRELGPPPKHIAPAGRMNAAGIPVFYGALDAETCVAELRLGIGECAVSCGFEVTRALYVLDLTGLSELYNQASLFHPDYDTISERLAFLHDFNATISRPVRPGAELDYLPTQALGEYLARHYDPRIDAVIYSSTQAGRSARNIVLLSHAAIVKGIGRQPSPRYEENWTDGGYAIWDRLGARRKKRKFATTFDFAGNERHESRSPKATEDHDRSRTTSSDAREGLVVLDAFRVSGSLPRLQDEIDLTDALAKISEQMCLVRPLNRPSPDRHRLRREYVAQDANGRVSRELPSVCADIDN